ncbi:tripartite tricarboxylate transporter substrate binding protein [Ramlibacter sp. AW1]|uniref:Tripartite tricarboxylate transporter substrate binding protein n=1 Tax=Ramlibacter aurantiacus TaxID=2801330 RepID=A0A936ZIB3_9BURK|nr:tripartite tricarboxylate transporter substrate binding protein [Ramlibacter aurantiacus]MBL0421944.1 tripartite tricarboxylate transporter substrate binding protein [Ramlibacter aurantiacus]
MKHTFDLACGTDSAPANKRRRSGLRRRAAMVLLAAASSMLAWSGPAAAQASNYPNRPIRMVVPFPAGESIDVIARIIAERWSTALGQNIVVENRGGAGGMIGTDQVAKSAPDGYTLLMGNVGGLSIIPATNAKTPYNLMRDFAPVSQVSNVPFFMFVSAQTPFTNAQGVVDYAKKNPGKLNFASTGIGSGVHLAGELFKNVAGVDIVHVPYKGVSLALPELIAGNVQLVFYPITFLPQVKDGKLRPLMITADRRSTALPDVPTAAEAGMPRMLAGSWHAVVAPAGTPPEVLDKLHKTLSGVLKDPAVRDKMMSFGAEPIGSSPTELKKFLETELETWRSAASAAGVKFE